MIIRFPDKPVEVYPDSLDSLDDGSSFCQSKADGFRCLLTKDSSHSIIRGFGHDNWDEGDGHFFLSRRGIPKGGPTRLQISREIVEEIKGLNLPENTMIDAEWLERRTKQDGIGECLYLHDILWLNDKWQGKIPCRDRFKILVEMVNAKSPVRVVDFVEKGFMDFFKKQREMPWHEGIVIKDKSQTIIGSRKECQKNPLWLKCKWRSGSNGRKVVF